MICKGIDAEGRCISQPFLGKLHTPAETCAACRQTGGFRSPDLDAEPEPPCPHGTDTGEKVGDCCHHWIECRHPMHAGAVVRFSSRHCATCAKRRSGVAVILPARNEGAEVAATVESWRAAGADEILVVDDGSDDGSCDSIPGGARLIRNKKPLGPAHCRNRWTETTAPVVCFADAHTRIDAAGLAILKEQAEQRHGIICAAVRSFDQEKDWTGYGGRLVETDKGGAGYAVKYRPRPAQPFERIGGLIGSVYCAPRSVMRLLNGWPPTAHWGYNEQALSLAAAGCGVPIWIARDVVALHKFRKKFSYMVSNKKIHVNRFLVHRYIFQDTWPAWRERLARAYPQDVDAADVALCQPAFIQACEVYRGRRCMSDKEIMAAVGG